METLPRRIAELLSDLQELEARREEIHEELSRWYANVSATMSTLGVAPASCDFENVPESDTPPSAAGAHPDITQREMVVEAVKAAERPVRSDDIQTIVANTFGQSLPASNIRAHLAHAVDTGELVRVGRGLYAGEDTPRDPGLPMDAEEDDGADCE